MRRVIIIELGFTVGWHRDFVIRLSVFFFDNFFSRNYHMRWREESFSTRNHYSLQSNNFMLLNSARTKRSVSKAALHCNIWLSCLLNARKWRIKLIITTHNGYFVLTISTILIIYTIFCKCKRLMVGRICAANWLFVWIVCVSDSMCFS